jgi:hypothetical protein
MIQRNELRLQYYIAKLQEKIAEEHNAKAEVQRLELRNKLASMYLNDPEGYERALKFCGVFVETPKEKTEIEIVKHLPRSKL